MNYDEEIIKSLIELKKLRKDLDKLFWEFETGLELYSGIGENEEFWREMFRLTYKLQDLSMGEDNNE